MQIKVIGYSYSTNDRNDGGAAEEAVHACVLYPVGSCKPLMSSLLCFEDCNLLPNSTGLANTSHNLHKLPHPRGIFCISIN